MKLKELNSGIIYTNADCIGCNKCISGCIAVGANVVVKDDNSDQYVVMVDPNKCILCGHCVEECVHNARTYKDDTDDFFAALERGENISILVAPSLLTDYEKQYHNILGYLMHLGVKHIYNSSFGADIMVWIYMNLIHSFGLSGVISQFCPVIVNYLEKYKPELLDYLMPVQSPMMCTAIYVSDYLKIDDKLAYISPCIAEKYEIEDVNTYGKVSYNVTFKRLMERLEQLDISKYYAEDEVSYGLGALVSSAGGLSSNIRPYIGFNKVLIQTSGYSNIFPYFDHYYTELSANDELPFLVDVLSCTNGCCFGTGTCYGVEHRNEVTFSTHRVTEKAYQSGNVPTALNYEERLSLLNERFKDFELSSFVRQYNIMDKVQQVPLSDEEIEAVFQSMFKDNNKRRHTDCGSCGYKTCHEMACAIGMNINHKENCINYSKHRIQLETEKTSRLLSEISLINAELKESAQLKSNFLANMSHEIRTPMNAVIGMAEMALRGDLPNEERGYLQQIKASGRSLLAIINDILDFSKIESGKMELNESDYVVMSLINDSVNIALTRIGEKNITLIVDADPEIPFTLHGDDIRIKQVLVNLVSNAVKFTESGYVAISMCHERCEEGICLIVSVRDSGIGIKEADLDKLFSSFQQVDSMRNRNIEGTGLGLAISRELINMMNGMINIESTYGSGSTFSFRIPQRIVDDLPSVSLNKKGTVKIASFIENLYVKAGFTNAILKLDIVNTECTSLQDMETAVNAGVEFIFIDCPLWNGEIDAFAKLHRKVQTVIIIDPRKDIVTASYVYKLNQPIYSLSIASMLNHETCGGVLGNHLQAEEFRFEAPDAKVLIVDDNAINLTVAKGLLSPLHMQITLASGAREAIRLIEDNLYDIILMDHMMPDIDGIEATRIIRNKEDNYYKKLPIIALTANAVNNAKELFLREGMNDFIAKPIEIRDIASIIRKWLPPEKIINVKQNECSTVTHTEDEIPIIEGIDVKSGITLSGTLAFYKKILADYYSVIEKKAALIEKYEAEGDIKAFTIEVHALKSTSRLIGAMELSETAALLEKYGLERNIELIKAETPYLLRCYRAYLPLLAPFQKVDSISPEIILSSEQIRENLLVLNDALDNFDINTATAILAELKNCKLDEPAAKLRACLSDALDEVEYDDAAAIVNEWMEDL